MSTAPDRQAVEKIAGQPLQDWQWYAFLALLHLPTGTPAIVAPVAAAVSTGPAPVKKKSRRLQDSVEYTCELCGREGTRRFVQTATGWRCAPSSAERCRRHQERAPKVRGIAAQSAKLSAAQDVEIVTRYGAGESVRSLAANFCVSIPTIYNAIKRAQIPASDSCAKPETPQIKHVDVAKPEPRPSPGLPVTARCQDCTRTFTLTGRVLTQAVEMHELKHGHIVIVDEAAAAS